MILIYIYNYILRYLEKKFKKKKKIVKEFVLLKVVVYIFWVKILENDRI